MPRVCRGRRWYIVDVTTAKQLELSDGRLLDVYVSGPQGGVPLIYHHGTPGAGVQERAFARAAHARGLRFVTTSRAGYGGSTRRPQRRVVDVVADTAEVLAWLGAPRCLVAGASGGGPHTLACAARLDGVDGALSIASLAPYEAVGLDWMNGMGEDNVLEFGAALEGEDVLRTFLETQLEELRTVTVQGIIDSMSTLLPNVDRAVLTGEFGEDLANQIHEGLRISVDGWLDDDLAFAQPWGFELSEIKVPTMIWQGDEDLMVPFSHGQWLASQLPQAHAHLERGEGHLSVAIGAKDRMLDELVSASGVNDFC
jgi:pimeloyl-ACP methyl ester carboxylesterase